MKKSVLLTLMFLMALIGAAKDLKTVRLTTEPPMSCANCENKIKKNVRFEKGVQQITTDLDGQVVTIVYDADKTDAGKIAKAFDKIHYKATVLEDGAQPSAAPGCCKANDAKTCTSKEGGCCKAKDGDAAKCKDGKCCKAGEAKACKSKSGNCCK